jgi:hypothetical protein
MDSAAPVLGRTEPRRGALKASIDIVGAARTVSRMPADLTSHLSKAELVARGVPEALFVDGTDLECRLLTKSLMTNGAAFFEAIPATMPVSQLTEDHYRGTLKMVEVFAAENGIDPLAELSDADRQRLIEGWLATQSKDVATGTLKSYRRALKWWARLHELPNPITEEAAAILGLKPGRGPARPMSVVDYNTTLLALMTNSIVTAPSPAYEIPVQAWHLRQRVRLTLAVACSLRAVSELPQLTEDCIVSFDDDGIAAKLPFSKGKHEPQDIKLLYRNDVACPVAALYDFFQFCELHAIPRHGLLAPYVYRTRGVSTSLTTPTADERSERGQWYTIAASVGLDRRSSLHSLRAMMPVAAARDGWGLHRVKTLTRHAGGETAAIYANRFTAEPIELFSGDEVS